MCKGFEILQYGTHNDYMLWFIHRVNQKLLEANELDIILKEVLEMANIINKNLIKLNINNNSKDGVIKILAKLIKDENRLNNYDEYVEEVLHRESLTTTGIGYGIAIPHGKCKAVEVPTVAVGRISKGVEWESLDDNPVQVVFLLAVPEEAASDQHLRILAALSRKLMNEEFRHELFNSVDEEKLLELLSNVFKGI